MKTCTGCGETKALELFSKDIWQKDGKRKKCKACDAMRAAERRRGIMVKASGPEIRKPAPPWLTEDQFDEIKGFYDLAEFRTIRSGILHVVDHVIPLGSTEVCGLHVPWNLQVLTMVENSIKGVKFDGGW